MILAFWVPIQVVFFVPFDGLVGSDRLTAYTALLWADIAISMNTAIYDKGLLITSRSFIFWNYLKNYFVSEVLGAMSLLFHLVGERHSEATGQPYSFSNLSILIFLLNIKKLNTVIQKG